MLRWRAFLHDTDHICSPSCPLAKGTPESSQSYLSAGQIRTLPSAICCCRYFTVEGCELRIGVYESFDTLCIYLESDAFGAGLERNFWVKYRIAIVNQKYPERTEWKESSICTKTWNNSVLQFMKASFQSTYPSRKSFHFISAYRGVNRCEAAESHERFSSMVLRSVYHDGPCRLLFSSVPQHLHGCLSEYLLSRVLHGF